MLQFIKTLKTDDSGATAIEYGLIAALVAVGLITALTTLGTDLSGIFGDVSTELQGAGN
jgi:pilus assembly protein Flp/PilA